jgi:hypothetical protein
VPEVAWSNSKIFRQYVADSLNRTAALDLNSDTFKAALYTNTPTPDQNVSAVLSAYNATSSQWLTANEQYAAGQWAQAGVALTSVVVDVATAAVVMFDAADTASGSAANLTAVYGCLVYDDTIAAPVAKQGVCYNYFGGSNTVVNGTFTIVWSASGIMRFTL